jgi:hypothetical protein
MTSTTITFPTPTSSPSMVVTYVMDPNRKVWKINKRFKLEVDGSFDLEMCVPLISDYDNYNHSPAPLHTLPIDGLKL